MYNGRMDFYLGLTGLPGTGKEAVSRLITAELAAHGIQTLHYSLSGPIALELRRRGLPPDREQLRTMANNVRANLGNGAWASRIAREAQETLDLTDWTDVFVMIDGVRNPAEIDVFRQLWGSRFHLLAVSAPEAVRLRNLTVRSSPKDAAVLEHLARAATDSAATDSAAIAPVLTAEMGIGQPQHGTNVVACIELADWTLENAEHDATLVALRQQVRTLVERDVLPLYRRTAPAGVDRPFATLSPTAGPRQGEAATRALVVESDPAWQMRLAALLEQEGCTVEFAASYAEAGRKLLDQPQHMPYHLMTVDLHLPGERTGGADSGADSGADGHVGFELLESLHYFGRSLPSIIVSAQAAAEQVARAFRDLGVRDYYSKQRFAPHAFRARVRTLLLSPFYVVAAIEANAAAELRVGSPYTLSLRVQPEAPPQRPRLGNVLCLQRPTTAKDWPLAVVATAADLRIDWQPGAEQLLSVPADSLAAPLTYTLTPLAPGSGRLEIEFHQPGRYVERLAFNVSARPA